MKLEELEARMRAGRAIIEANIASDDSKFFYNLIMTGAWNPLKEKLPEERVVKTNRGTAKIVWRSGTDVTESHEF